MIVHELEVYSAIQMWIKYFGQNILDRLMDICDPDTDIAEERYCDFTTTFKKHFNYSPYLLSQAMAGMPFIGLDTRVYGDTNSCSNTTMSLTFNNGFKTVGPNCDGHCICNSPTCILEYKEFIICALTEMFSSEYLDETGHVKQRDIISDLSTITSDYDHLRIDVTRVEVSEVKVYEEMLFFKIQYDIEVYSCN